GPSVPSLWVVEFLTDDFAEFFLGMPEEKDEIDDDHDEGAQERDWLELIIESLGDVFRCGCRRETELLPLLLHRRRLVQGFPGLSRRLLDDGAATGQAQLDRQKQRPEDEQPDEDRVDDLPGVPLLRGNVGR